MDARETLDISLSGAIKEALASGQGNGYNDMTLRNVVGLTSLLNTLEGWDIDSIGQLHGILQRAEEARVLITCEQTTEGDS